jgi:hypothetical protein
VVVEPLGEWYQIAEILDHRGRACPTQQCLVRWEGFDASHDSWVPRCDITPKALIAYEEFLHQRQKPRYWNRQRVSNGHVYTDEAGKAFQQKLTSFIGKNGEYSVLEKSDNRRTSKMSAPRGEREKVDARRNDDDDPQILTTASQSASDTDAPAAAGGGRARKPPVLSCLTLHCYLKNRMLRYYDAENASVSFVDILLSVLVVCT